MDGNLLPVGHDMKTEIPQRDKIIFTISRPQLSKDFLEESHYLFEKQTEETDVDYFILSRVMEKIGQTECMK